EQRGQAERAAAWGARGDVDGERPAEELGPGTVATTPRGRRRRALGELALRVWLGSRRRERRRHDLRTPLGRGSEHTCVPDTVLARRRDGGGEARQERERVEVDGGGAVAEGTAEDDAHEVVGEQPQAFLCDRRAQDVLDEGLARAGVVGASVGGGMQREAHL